MNSGKVHATFERVVAPSGAVYVNLVLTYIRPDEREFSLKLDPALAEDLIKAVQAVKNEALVARQEAIAETAAHKAKVARDRLEGQAK
jgi:hypothetical protein